MHDTHTPAERAYDRLVLSRRTIGAMPAAPDAQPAPSITEPARTIEDVHRAQIESWNQLDADEQLFASAITHWTDNLPESHRAMGQAGLILLVAACNQVGPADDDDEEEVAAARIYHAAFTQGHQEGYDKGLKDGMDGTLDLIRKKLEEHGALPKGRATASAVPEQQ